MPDHFVAMDIRQTEIHQQHVRLHDGEARDGFAPGCRLFHQHGACVGRNRLGEALANGYGTTGGIDLAA
jgi:hypothetical protein